VRSPLECCSICFIPVASFVTFTYLTATLRLPYSSRAAVV
jgi:hypothetical protein